MKLLFGVSRKKAPNSETLKIVNMEQIQRKKKRLSENVHGNSRPKYAALKAAEVQPSTLPLGLEDERLCFLRRSVAAHIESFNFATGPGLRLICDHMEPAIVRGPKVADEKSQLISVRFHSLSLLKPRVNLSGAGKTSLMSSIYPAQCRRVGASYQGELYGGVKITIDGKEEIEVPVQKIARVPIMVGSKFCHLRGKSRRELVSLGEEEFEVGGYFISNGAEKLIRLIVVPRSNHPISAKRDKNAARDAMFSDLSLSYRSIRSDLSTYTMHFHLLRSGAVCARLTIDRNEYFIPVGVLFRSFLPSETTDREIYELIVGGDTDNSALCKASIAIIKELSRRYPHFRNTDTEPLLKPKVSRTAAIAYLGRSFKAIIGMDDPDVSSLEAGTAFLRRYVLVHLSVGSFEEENRSMDRSKADLLVQLVRKLVGTSTGDIAVDDADALSHQSVMTSGNLFLSLLRESIENVQRVVTGMIRKEATKATNTSKADGAGLRNLILECVTKAIRKDLVTVRMAYLLSTGTLRTNTGLDLPQTVGFCVAAERINFLRFISHFRAVHRGAFYASMRSTKVRKLLPEAWGFICPVHTPDGDPCGILNHLTSAAIVTQGSTAELTEILDLFSDFNLQPAPALSEIHTSTSQRGKLPVIVDGRVLGFIESESAQELVNQIRYTKIRQAVKVLPDTTEVILIQPQKAKSGFQPGVYVHTNAGRLMRPVVWLTTPTRRYMKGDGENIPGLSEWIGSLEQVFLRVRPAFGNAESSLSKVNTYGASHAEASSVTFLSMLASLSPFPEMNQGPRNMFQCQMAKQTMGTPCHTTWSRMESKIYRHTYPQVPITRNTCMQDPMGADIFPNGVNAVVAVISYTGNDMEDALIINKASLDRGFAHGTVYVNQRVNLDESVAGQETEFTQLSAEECAAFGSMDTDGLAAVGSRLKQGSKLYSTCGSHVKSRSNNRRWKEYKSVEDGTVDEVIIYDSDMYKNARTSRGQGVREANIRTRVSRKPSVGDKFASRAGQKGTMSAAWPSEDMPFSESGMTPDILFNPNGFPSRMTIGMMVELMSGKAGALHGHFNDSSPFQFDDEHRAIDFFAEQLTKAGYEYAGNETLYSGYTGEAFEVNIFTGIVHYQRLRHMVSDKFQVRTTGAINPLFRQPIKGRKKGGAIRFGEMERDGLLAHGASFLLRDRLAIASDLHVLHICKRCGSLLAPIRTKGSRGKDSVFCRACQVDGKGNQVEKVALPYSFKYLVNELAAMNIRTVFGVKEVV